ncbi:MAG: ribosomal-protein-alanine N-acetyltransferase [Oceanospirillaceae bacterium]|jgi:ribosomal-protein-alanine N-acetyltransferase
MTINPTLYTSRFKLKAIEDTPTSNAHLIEMMQDQRVQRYITGHALSDAEVLVRLERFHCINNHNGQGFWLIYNESQTCVGMCLLKPMPTEQESNYIETGYWIKPNFWGQGIAAEAASRLVEYAFLELQLEQVTAVADAENIASIKSLLRAGLKRDGNIIAYETKLPFFCITRKQFDESFTSSDIKN